MERHIEQCGHKPAAAGEFRAVEENVSGLFGSGGCLVEADEW